MGLAFTYVAAESVLDDAVKRRGNTVALGAPLCETTRVLPHAERDNGMLWRGLERQPFVTHCDEVDGFLNGGHAARVLAHAGSGLNPKPCIGGIVGIQSDASAPGGAGMRIDRQP
jgi:hypothetical protein